MKLICPRCQHRIDLDTAMNMNDLRELAEVAARLGDLWGLANEYVNSFRADPDGRITPQKRLRLLKDVAKLIEQCEFAFQGRRYRTDRMWVHNALMDVCNAQKIGFKNHNYLKKVLLAEAERVSAEGLTAREERRRETKRKHQIPPGPPLKKGGDGGGPPAERGEDGSLTGKTCGDEDEALKPMSVDEFKRSAGINSLIEKIGGGPHEYQVR